MQFDDKITFRIPKQMKRKLHRVAKGRLLLPADIAREALQNYLAANNGGNGERKKAA